MVIIILDINNNVKNFLLYKINKQKFINEINSFKFFENAEVIDPIMELESYINKIYNIDFPIYKTFSVNVDFLDSLSRELKFNNNCEVLLPCFNGTEYWVKAKLLNKELFLSYLYNSNILNNITIISMNKSLYDNIYDIEIGENSKTYELRVYKIDNE